MKTNLFLAVILLSTLVTSCSCKQNSGKTSDKASLLGTTWELEYISGPRIAFAGLYPETKPYLTLSSDNQFGGNSSCNVFSGTYSLKENTIQFGDAIKTMRFCEGGGEETFLNMLGKVNKYSIDSDGKLVLLTDDIPMMRLKKIQKPQQ